MKEENGEEDPQMEVDEVEQPAAEAKVDMESKAVQDNAKNDGIKRDE